MKRIIAIAAAAALITAPTVAILASTTEQTTSDNVSETESDIYTTAELTATYEPPLVSSAEISECETSETPLTNSDVTILARMVWGEARGCAPEEQRLVVWTVLQRVDAGGVFAQYDTIEAAVTAPGQFVGYDENHPVDPDIYNLCLEVLSDWQSGAEPPTHEIYAPTAPYYFFDGDGRHNWFREEW